MPEKNAATGKGKPFFDRGDHLAELANWDYAIEMYLQGISRDPEDIDNGLQKLHDTARARKANGGKPAGFFEKRKHKSSKDPLENLNSALWVMSRDPSNLSVWKGVVEAALLGKWEDMLKWAGNILFDLNRLADKPSKDIYTFLIDIFEKAELYSDAVRVCQKALNEERNKGRENVQLDDRLKDLSARETIQKGHYDEEGSFTKSVKDLKGQLDLNQADQMTQSDDYLDRQIEKTRQEYLDSPDQAGKVNAFVDALLKKEDEGLESEAIGVLEKAFKDSGAYRFKMRIGDIKISQLSRRGSKLMTAGDKAAAKEVAKQLLSLELEEYAERAANYPTDLSFKYELGRRQFFAGKFDDAIASLQQARRDPKRRASSMSMLGQAFYQKQWYNEAADTFTAALDGDITENRRKELQYHYGLVLEAQEKFDQALDIYSDIVQIDFNYKDVRKRVERIRNEKK